MCVKRLLISLKRVFAEESVCAHQWEPKGSVPSAEGLTTGHVVGADSRSARRLACPPLPTLPPLPQGLSRRGLPLSRHQCSRWEPWRGQCWARTWHLLWESASNTELHGSILYISAHVFTFLVKPQAPLRTPCCICLWFFASTISTQHGPLSRVVRMRWRWLKSSYRPGILLKTS